MSVELDEIRENRIKTEIIVDADDKEERAMGWYYYLDDTLNCPFLAIWKKKRGKNSTEEKQVEVQGMAPEDQCLKDMFVEVIIYPPGKEEEDLFSARLSDIEAIDADSETEVALKDWRYWLGRGYKF